MYLKNGYSKINGGGFYLSYSENITAVNSDIEECKTGEGGSGGGIFIEFSNNINLKNFSISNSKSTEGAGINI